MVADLKPLYSLEDDLNEEIEDSEEGEEGDNLDYWLGSSNLDHVTVKRPTAIDMKNLSFLFACFSRRSASPVPSIEESVQDSNDFLEGKLNELPEELPLAGYSLPLNQVILNDPSTELSHLKALFFILRSVCPKEESGHFNYVLLDPAFCRDIHKQVDDMTRSARVLGCRPAEADLRQVFQHFVRSIFYVGKGGGRRHKEHLDEALKCLNDKNKPQSAKVAKILQIWRDGRGVVMHKFSGGIGDFRGYVQEALIIEAIGLHNLTNSNTGHQKFQILQMADYNLKLLGSYLLLKAFSALLIKGMDEIRPLLGTWEKRQIHGVKGRGQFF